MDSKTIEALSQQIAARLFIPLEASGRHVHVTKEQAMILFGHPLTPKRPLSQPGQFLSCERLTIRTDKGVFHNVAVLGPERRSAQVEVSLTDARALGIDAPLRQSGHVEHTPGITLEGPEGKVGLVQGVMAAQRHIHLSVEEAAHFGVRDQQVVSLQTYTQRPAILQDVVVRVSPDFRAAVHLDYDEANACGLRSGDLGRILP